MFNFSRSTAAMLLAVIALASPAVAQPADLPTYQGRLTDNGQPANGTYEINVNYYDSAVGGTWLAGDGHTGVVVTDGLFMVPLAAYEFSSFANGPGEIWLDLEVRPMGSFDPYTPLTPRQIVTRAPLAHRALNAFNADNADTATTAGTAAAADFALTSGTGLTDAYLNDPTINSLTGIPVTIAGAGLQVGVANASSGFIRLFNDTSSNHLVALEAAGSLGGRITLRPQGGVDSTVNIGQSSYGVSDQSGIRP